MTKAGYAWCRVCSHQMIAAYKPKGWKLGDELHVWGHVSDAYVTGWGRQPICEGSYQPGENSRLLDELEGNEPEIS